MTSPGASTYERQLRPRVGRRLGVGLCVATWILAAVVPLTCMLPGVGWPTIAESVLFGAFQGWMVAMAFVVAIWIVLAPGNWSFKLALTVLFSAATLATNFSLGWWLIQTNCITASWLSASEILQVHNRVSYGQLVGHAVALPAAVIALLIMRYWRGWRLDHNNRKPKNVLRARMIVLVAVLATLVVPVFASLLWATNGAGGVWAGRLFGLLFGWLCASLVGVIAAAPCIWAIMGSGRGFSAWIATASVVGTLVILLRVFRLPLSEQLRLPVAAWATFYLALSGAALILNRGGYRLVRYGPSDLQSLRPESPAGQVQTRHPLDD